MGRPIIKADREHDLYMEWSTVVEAPTFAGTRAELANYLRDSDAEQRLQRADNLGTSSMVAPDELYEGTLPGQWDDTGLIVEQKGWLPRGRIYDWLMAGCPDHMLDPFEDG